MVGGLLEGLRGFRIGFVFHEHVISVCYFCLGRLSRRVTVYWAFTFSAPYLLPIVVIGKLTHIEILTG